MTEKYVYTDVKSFGQMKKIQSRTADRKNEGGNDGEKTEYVKLTRVAPDPRTGERPEIFQEEAFQAASSGCIVAITLGIICVILLGISAFFASKYFQNSFNYQNMLDNGTQEYDQNLLDNGTQEHEKSRTPMKNKCFSKDRLNSENYREEYKNKWSCCEEKCYYFSDILKTFEESRKFCSNQGSHLLKIEDEDEQEFIQSLVSYFSWIGLSRKGIVSPWKWEDGSLLENKLNLQNSNINNNNCAYVAANKVAASVCTKRFFFICEKNYT
ncbi:C-type lectin domain family 7 member A-like isoform X2 [Cervus elaphus]|uniref:C-type lectin domain family 7 member A-like isoform X2 n=1 Tax=Cervus elaphus TaxID=9860 RepID=UPI001CC2D724|nr:C-type lectin domain family 7 member A-like isoform X2 [Cervus elaphus]